MYRRSKPRLYRRTIAVGNTRLFVGWGPWPGLSSPATCTVMPSEHMTFCCLSADPLRLACTAVQYEGLKLAVSDRATEGSASVMHCEVVAVQRARGRPVDAQATVTHSEGMAAKAEL